MPLSAAEDEAALKEGEVGEEKAEIGAVSTACFGRKCSGSSMLATEMPQVWFPECETREPSFDRVIHEDLSFG
jgi:hypothetical protein